MTARNTVVRDCLGLAVQESSSAPCDRVFCTDLHPDLQIACHYIVIARKLLQSQVEHILNLSYSLLHIWREWQQKSFQRWKDKISEGRRKGAPCPLQPELGKRVSSFGLAERTHRTKCRFRQVSFYRALTQEFWVADGLQSAHSS